MPPIFSRGLCANCLSVTSEKYPCLLSNVKAITGNHARIFLPCLSYTSQCTDNCGIAEAWSGNTAPKISNFNLRFYREAYAEFRALAMKVAPDGLTGMCQRFSSKSISDHSPEASLTETQEGQGKQLLSGVASEGTEKSAMRRRRPPMLSVQ